MVDIINDPDCQRAGRHRELEKAEVKKCEESVQQFQLLHVAVRNFIIPFTVAHKNMLYSLASGAPVPMEVKMDVLRAEALG